MSPGATAQPLSGQVGWPVSGAGPRSTAAPQSDATQRPALQVPPVHGVPAEANPSAGRAVEAPSQVSATSHGPKAARHTAPFGLVVGDGQVVVRPSQVPGDWHNPAAALQTVSFFTTPQVPSAA